MSNAFLEQTRNNLENLSETKVLYVTKGCLEKLARAKSALRAQELKKSLFGATDLYPPQVLDHGVPVPNQPHGGAQNNVKIIGIFFWYLET